MPVPTLTTDRLTLSAFTLDDAPEVARLAGDRAIAVPHWNLGYATEAARAVLAYGFGELGLRRIHAGHLTRNPASGRVMEKLGMEPEGVFRQHILKWAVPEDVAHRGILREEFRGTSGSPGDSPGSTAR